MTDGERFELWTVQSRHSVQLCAAPAVETRHAPCERVACRYWAPAGPQCVLALADERPRTQDEIAAMYAVTKQAVQQVEARALRRLALVRLAEEHDTRGQAPRSRK